MINPFALYPAKGIYVITYIDSHRVTFRQLGTKEPVEFTGFTDSCLGAYIRRFNKGTKVKLQLKWSICFDKFLVKEVTKLRDQRTLKIA